MHLTMRAIKVGRHIMLVKRERCVRHQSSLKMYFQVNSQYRFPGSAAAQSSLFERNDSSVQKKLSLKYDHTWFDFI